MCYIHTHTRHSKNFAETNLIYTKILISLKEQTLSLSTGGTPLEPTKHTYSAYLSK